MEVYFDLETTSLKESCHILQLAACTADGRFTFSRYVKPTSQQEIKCLPKSTRIHNMWFDESTRKMTHHGRDVPYVHVCRCIFEFTVWLWDIKARYGRKVILIAHNSKRFDAPRLVRAARSAGMLRFFAPVVWGFSDTLPLFRDLYKGQCTRFRLEDLVAHFLPNASHSAHDARSDAKVLADIVQVERLSQWLHHDDYKLSLRSVLSSLRARRT